MPAILFYTGKSISVINSKLFGLKCLCAIFWDCNEDISVKFANITHYVELIYNYHTIPHPLFYLHSLGGRTLLLSLHPRRYIYTFTVHPGG